MTLEMSLFVSSLGGKKKLGKDIEKYSNDEKLVEEERKGSQ